MQCRKSWFLMAILIASPAVAMAEDSPEPASSGLDRPFLYDKILGLLVGSAIGDSFGAPTEMWPRPEIEAQYGFVEGLGPLVREASPEGTWGQNLPSGSTTDDTRWKALMIDFLIENQSAGLQASLEPKGPNLNAGEFARFMLERQKDEIAQLQKLPEPEAADYIDMAMRLNWLLEWERVARAYLSGDVEQYSNAVNRFYGGEMVCAGMLFCPVIGAYYPGDPEAAYRQTQAVDIYDLGYANDISGLTAAMIAAAIPPGATAKSILAVLLEVDPEHFFSSRLVGRLAYSLYQDARRIVYESKKIRPEGASEEEVERAQRDEAFKRLEKMNQRMPFHAGEIHLVNLTALLFTGFDFRRSMQFVVNFGRDNDTTGAVTGAILGAYLGAGELPQDWVERSLEANRKLGIDLESKANSLTDAILNRAEPIAPTHGE